MEIGLPSAISRRYLSDLAITNTPAGALLCGIESMLIRENDSFVHYKHTLHCLNLQTYEMTELFQIVDSDLDSSIHMRLLTTPKGSVAYTLSSSGGRHSMIVTDLNSGVLVREFPLSTLNLKPSIINKFRLNHHNNRTFVTIVGTFYGGKSDIPLIINLDTQEEVA